MTLHTDKDLKSKNVRGEKMSLHNKMVLRPQICGDMVRYCYLFYYFKLILKKCVYITSILIQKENLNQIRKNFGLRKAYFFVVHIFFFNCFEHTKKGI